MRIRPRHAIRACLAAGLALTALPTTRSAWLPIQHASAAPFAIRGLSPALISQAAKQPIPVILLLRPGAQDGGASVLRTLEDTGASKITPLGIIGGISAQVSDSTLNALRQNPNLMEVTSDRLHLPVPVPDSADLNAQIAHVALQRASAVPSGAQVIQQPDTLGIIHADAAQKKFDGRGVRLALIDSGVDYNHPDLQGIMLRDANGKPLYQDFTGSGDLTDTVGHGTSCAGVIAAQSRTIYSVDNTYRVTVYPLADPTKPFHDVTYFRVGGVAPGVKLMAAKIFDSRVPGQGAYDSNIVRAIQWAIANHADVISESFGAPASFFTGQGTDVIGLADEEAVRHGITVVAADGNAGPGQSSVSSPAQAPDVIAVGASTDYTLFAQTGRYANYGAATSDNVASFTSRGPTFDGRIRPDVFAPGSFGWSTVPRNPTSESPSTPPYLLQAFGGTSMATPVVAGTAALVINAYMETHGGHHPTPAYVKQVLLSTADDLGYPAIDQAAGRVDALRAVNLVTHQGPAVLLSGSLALRGQIGQRVSQSIAVTNSGSTTEQVTLQPQMLRQVAALNFSGTASADNLYTYKFDVPAGITRITAAAFWDHQRRVPFPGSQGDPVGLRMRLYDPQGRFVNYDVSGDNGTATVRTTAGKPIPGRWTAIVIQSSRPDHQHVAHFVNVPFTATITLDGFRDAGGTVSPSALTLRPGQRSTVTFTSDPLNNPGVSIVSLHVREHSATAVSDALGVPGASVETIPVVITTVVSVHGDVGSFSGVFTGANNDSFLDEISYFDFTVPQGTKNMMVSVEWQHKGNWFLLTLLNPDGKAISLEDNSLLTTSSQVDLSQHAEDGFLDKPMPGHWQIQLIDYQFAGNSHREPFSGTVRFNQSLVSIDTHAVSVQSGGGGANFTIHVRNVGAALQAYFTDPTTDQYAYMALGGTGGVLQDGPLGPASTQVLTYTTNFVPPGTREIISQAKALNSNLPVAIQLFDPVLGSFARITSGTLQRVGGGAQGTTVTVSAPELPIGAWENLLTLPASKHTGPVYIQASTSAYALAPNPWINLDAQLQPDLTLSSSPPFVPPGATVAIKGKVSVPDNVASGTYHSHIFVYSALNRDKIADLPLDITVSGAVAQTVPTPDPFLAAIASTQYFPEGATATGLTDQMDLVNPTNANTHAQIRLLTDTGWTTVNRYALKPHSRMSVDMQSLVGKDQAIAAVVQGDQPLVSGRLIARAGAAGSYSVGTATPATRWYFADGYTVGTFAEYLTVVNSSGRQAHVHLHLVTDQGDLDDANFTVNPSSRSGVKINDLLSNKAVSATITSDIPVVAERTQIFGSQGQGVTTAIGAVVGATSAYIDPGHLPAGTQAHISLYNPHGTTAHVQMALVDSHGTTAHTITLKIGAGKRATVDLTAKYHTADLGARITSDVGVVAEKVGYFGNFARSRMGGSDLPAVPAPAAQVIFPGGSTANGAGDYLSIYNPASKAISATITVLFNTNQTVQHTVSLPANHRTTIKISSLGVPNGPSSVIVAGVDGAQLYATQTIMNAAHTDGSEISGIPSATP